MTRNGRIDHYSEQEEEGKEAEENGIEDDDDELENEVQRKRQIESRKTEREGLIVNTLVREKLLMYSENLSLDEAKAIARNSGALHIENLALTTEHAPRVQATRDGDQHGGLRHNRVNYRGSRVVMERLPLSRDVDHPLPVWQIDRLQSRVSSGIRAVMFDMEVVQALVNLE
ncbi:hypothetical protein HPB50_025338 [Hyalomma asiaticum]|uniref:Uncharacterized protein n=1 Tax=Hyalomma asiaticum TaxID=266040 RepID=A0ACB7RX30_HYAAI|nr:hypothetical protein HPB50_025338 [Hyalomma asiaticum]